MSSSGSGTGTSPLGFINRASGLSLGQIAKQGIGGWLLAVSASVILGFQQLLEFLFLPFTLFTDVASESVQGFFIDPITGIVPVGISVTAGRIDIFGIFAAPVSAVLALMTIGVAIAFIALSATSNVIPGLVVDNPLWDFFFGTPEEEVEGED